MGLKTISISLLCTAALFPTIAASDNAKWQRVKSRNFEILTDAGDKRARETLLEFERVSSFFEQSMGRPIKPDVPLRIVLFKSEKEFLNYRMAGNEVAVAYYLPGADADYIVMHNAGDSRIAIHEFVHLLVKRSYQHFTLPTWLNEGIAELYSTMKPVGGKIQIGGLIAGHMYLFRTERTIPLADLVSAGHDSALYNRKRHAGMFYAESWALTHMLQLSPAYRTGYGKFADQLEKEVPAAEALEAAYGKPLARIEADLRGYMRGDSFFGVNFDIKLQGKLGDQVSVETAPEGEVDVALASLLSAAGHRAEAQTLLTAAATRDPKDPAVAIAQGYMEWRNRKFEEAKAQFRKALELGTQNSRVLLDLARMTAGSDPQTSIAALTRLNKSSAASMEVKLMLAEQLLRQKIYGAAYGVLAPVTSVKKEDAFRFYRARARALDNLKAPAEAIDSAQRAQKFAVSPEDQEYIGQLVEYLTARQKRQTAAVTAELVMRDPGIERGAAPSFVEDEAPEGPVLRRKYIDEQGRKVEERVDPSKRSPHGAALQEVKGEFIALDCKGQNASVVLRTADGKTSTYLIKEPTNLVATNQGQGMEIDLTCGAQPPKQVSVWFEAAPDAATKTSGVLWQIHFH